MTGFTLGNISVVGTYYTHGLNLTPRGLLAAAAAAAAAGAAVAAVPYRIASPAGSATLSATLSPIYILSAVFNISSTAASSTARGLSSRPARSFSQLYSSQLPASWRSCQLFPLYLFSGSSQVIVIKLLP